MIKNGHPVTTYRESGLPVPEGATLDTEYDGARYESLPIEARRKIEDFFNHTYKKGVRFNTTRDSYMLKHMFEGLAGCYVSNDQAKDAMLQWGFEPKDPNAVNWIFKIRLKENL